MTRSLTLTLTLTSALLVGCRGPLPADETCDDMCEPYGSAFPGVGECRAGECSPTFGECFAKGDFVSCTAACAAQGSVCAENECAESTSMVIGSFEWCLDPEKAGVARPHACAEPIDWQFSVAARCCCEQSP